MLGVRERMGAPLRLGVWCSWWGWGDEGPGATLAHMLRHGQGYPSAGTCLWAQKTQAVLCTFTEFTSLMQSSLEHFKLKGNSNFISKPLLLNFFKKLFLV